MCVCSCVFLQYPILPLEVGTELPHEHTPKHTKMVFVNCGETSKNLTGHSFGHIYIEFNVIFVGTRFSVPTKNLVPTT